MNTIYKPKHLQSEKRTLTPSTDTKNTAEPATDDEKLLQQKISEQRCVALRNAMPTQGCDGDKYSLEFSLSGDMIELYFKGDRNKLLQILPNIYSMQNVSQNGSMLLLPEHYIDSASVSTFELNSMVMEYVMRFLPVIFPDKHDKWKLMWEKMIKEDGLKKLIFDAGHQHFSKFNKNGIAHIVGFLLNEYSNLFRINKYNAIAKVVEGDKEHHMRIELGKKNAIKKLQKEKIKEIYELFLNQ